MRPERRKEPSTPGCLRREHQESTYQIGSDSQLARRPTDYVRADCYDQEANDQQVGWGKVAAHRVWRSRVQVAAPGPPLHGGKVS